MPRYFRRRYARSIKKKYSFEQTSVQLAVPGYTADNPNVLEGQVSVPIVPPVTINGMRKVKNITISFGNAPAAATEQYASQFYYAIVYVPQGYSPQVLRVPDTVSDEAATVMYEANQFVMSTGLVELGAGPQRIFTRMSRNLNSGDSVYVIFKQVTAAQNGYALSALITYAISYT